MLDLTEELMAIEDRLLDLWVLRIGDIAPGESDPGALVADAAMKLRKARYMIKAQEEKSD